MTASFAAMGYDEQRAFLGLPDVSMKTASVYARLGRLMTDQFLTDLRAKLLRINSTLHQPDTPTS